MRLNAPQEAIVLSLRRSLNLPLDDLLSVTRHYINANVSRAGLSCSNEKTYSSWGGAHIAQINIQGLRAWLRKH
jgi:hypothetical protein